MLKACMSIQRLETFEAINGSLYEAYLREVGEAGMKHTSFFCYRIFSVSFPFSVVSRFSTFAFLHVFSLCRNFSPPTSVEEARRPVVGVGVQDCGRLVEDVDHVGELHAVVRHHQRSSGSGIFTKPQLLWSSFLFC